MDKLSFQWRHRLEVQPEGARKNMAMDGHRIGVEYIDFIVNGQSLADLCSVDQNDLTGMLKPESFTTTFDLKDCFNQFKHAGRLPLVLTLEIPTFLENRRVHIYGCPECGDLYCGSVTMQILETPNTVIWRHFDNGREKIAPYFNEDKWNYERQLLDLWLAEGKNYGMLGQWATAEYENDYEFIHAYKKGIYTIDREADIREDVVKEIDFPQVGPFEFGKTEYLAAFAALRASITQPG